MNTEAENYNKIETEIQTDEGREKERGERETGRQTG